MRVRRNQFLPRHFCILNALSKNGDVTARLSRRPVNVIMLFGRYRVWDQRPACEILARGISVQLVMTLPNIWCFDVRFIKCLTV